MKFQTAKVQPLDAGIIRSFKAHYRVKHIAWVVQELEDNVFKPKVNLRQAIIWASQAWCRVSQDTVCNCFQACRILPVLQQADMEASKTIRPGHGRLGDVRVEPAVVDELTLLLQQLSVHHNAKHVLNGEGHLTLEETMAPSCEAFTEEPLGDNALIEVATACTSGVGADVEDMVIDEVPHQDEETEPVPVTLRAAREAVATLSLFVQDNLPHDMVRLMDKLQHAVAKSVVSSASRQCTLEQFFSSVRAPTAITDTADTAAT